MRLLVWQDLNADMQWNEGGAMITNLIKPYELEVNRIRQEGGVLFPAQPPDAQDSRMIIHPPGYSMLLAVVQRDGDPAASHTRLRWLQLTVDALTAVLIFLLAALWFPRVLATIAGMLVALSPHLALYSLWLTPETLAVLPLAAAVYLIARGIKRPRIWTMIAAGALIGVSCWLRSNGLLLAPVLAVAVFGLVERGKRLKCAGALVAAMIVSIAPVTLRNWTAYHRFIPLSLGAGITLAEGIADYDDDGRFGMPINDGDVKHKDAAWHDRPDYARSIWVPDGVERDRARFSRGLSVIRSHPGWFGGVMMKRAFSMLRYNDSMMLGRNADIAHAPNVSAEPSFGHALSVSETSQPVWTSSPAELLSRGSVVSPAASVVLAGNGQTLLVTGDDSTFGDQFASEPIPVEKNTDYLLRLEVRVEQQPVAAKVTSADRRIMLVSDVMEKPNDKTKKKARKVARRNGPPDPVTDAAQIEGAAAGRETLILQMPFASGHRSDVRLIISNNGEAAARPSVEIAGAELFGLGPTPHRWTRGARLLVRGVQRNVYTTSRLLPLIAAGILLLALAGRQRELLLLLIVPAYYLAVQSAFHTEYRYILAIHYFLFVLGAATLYVAGALVKDGVSRMLVALRSQ
ncbi:MAG: glycosyltransferase family 39 protein [Acidobacteriota bacterium]